MKYKVMLKIMISLMLMVLFISTFQVVNADVSVGDISTITDGRKGNVEGAIRVFGGRLLGLVQLVASIIATVMLLANGMKYMRAAPSEKADIKKQAVVYLVGAIILFATIPILELIKNFMESL